MNSATLSSSPTPETIFPSSDQRRKLGKQKGPPACVRRLAQQVRGVELLVKVPTPPKGQLDFPHPCPLTDRESQTHRCQVRHFYPPVPGSHPRPLVDIRSQFPGHRADRYCHRAFTLASFLFYHDHTVTQGLRMCQVLRAKYVGLYLRVLRGFGTGHAWATQLRPHARLPFPLLSRIPGRAAGTPG